MSSARYEYIIDLLIKENMQLKNENTSLKQYVEILKQQSKDDDVILNFYGDDVDDDAETVVPEKELYDAETVSPDEPEESETIFVEKN
jgi:hypothetical protein